MMFPCDYLLTQLCLLHNTTYYSGLLLLTWKGVPFCNSTDWLICGIYRDVCAPRLGYLADKFLEILLIDCMCPITLCILYYSGIHLQPETREAETLSCLSTSCSEVQYCVHLHSLQNRQGRVCVCVQTSIATASSASSLYV